MVHFLYDEIHGKETQAVEDLVRDAHPQNRFLALWDCTGPTKWTTWGTSIRPVLVENALIVGIGETGTVAAYLQERFLDLNLSVIAVNSPTNFQQTKLKRHPNRVALYSSHYPPIQGRCDWKDLADISFDIGWLQHGILSESGGNLCKYSIANLITQYLTGFDLHFSASRGIIV